MGVAGQEVVKLWNCALKLISRLEFSDYLGNLLFLGPALSTVTIQNGVALAARCAGVDRIQDDLDPAVQVLILNLVILDDLIRHEN